MSGFSISLELDNASKALLNQLISTIQAHIAVQSRLITLETKLMHTLQEDLDAIAVQTTAIASLETFITGLEAMINAVPGFTPEQQSAIDAIFTNVSANTDKINTAMQTNVPPAV